MNVYPGWRSKRRRPERNVQQQQPFVNIPVILDKCGLGWKSTLAQTSSDIIHHHSWVTCPKKCKEKKPGPFFPWIFQMLSQPRLRIIVVYVYLLQMSWKVESKNGPRNTSELISSFITRKSEKGYLADAQCSGKYWQFLAHYKIQILHKFWAQKSRFF